MKKFLITATLLSTMFLLWCQKITNQPTETPNEIIQSTWDIETLTWDTQELTWAIIQTFQECLDAWFPIMESYPRQCNDGTTTFTETLPEEILTGEITEITWNNQEILTGEIEENQTWQELSETQQKLKALFDKKKTTTNESPEEPTENSEKVTEEDIENLEKILQEIITK